MKKAAEIINHTRPILKHFKNNGRFVPTHGRTFTTEYYSWKAMIGRCRNPNNPAYHNYGGRGIKVCDRWSEFKNFLEDMGHKPSPNQSIERINNNGDYAPSNCKWETSFNQCRNMRVNKMLTLNGRTMCLQDWANELKIKPTTLGMRLSSGWSVEKTLTKPKEVQGRNQHAIPSNAALSLGNM